jgi:hypothetical protein
MMIIVLLPDTVFGWKPDNYLYDQETAQEAKQEATGH